MNRRGFSLIEVTIASVILVVIVLIVYRILFTTQSATDRTTIRAYLQTQARTVSEGLSKEIAQALITGVAATNESMTLQLPVDHDGDGDALDAAGSIEFGYFDKDGAPHLNWTATYGVVLEETLDEAVLGVDVNRDGDKTDRFGVYRIERVTRDENGAVHDTLVLSHDLFLNAAQLDGDIDGDGTSDPLFLLEDENGAEVTASGARLKTNMTFGKQFSITEYVFHHSSLETKLRNAQ